MNKEKYLQGYLNLYVMKIACEIQINEMEFNGSSKHQKAQHMAAYVAACFNEKETMP